MAAPSSGTEDTIPASDLDTVEPSPAAELEPARPAPAPEERYKLGEEIGRGGMGRVVEAYDTQLGRTVALKEVLSSTSVALAKRFQREVRITARLEHSSIVALYDSGVMADGRPYYVMRRVSGRPLDQLIAGAKNLDERLALLPNVLAAIDAIGHAHRRGVIHRDLKPANILVGDLGETVVIDWGLAKVIGEEEPPPPSFEPHVPSAGDSLKTQVGSVFGTPGFMAPEQARGDDLDARSDVYALGATLYQLLAGRPPVGGSSATEVIASTLTKRVVPLAKVAPMAPVELATIIDKALAFEADARYADAGALAEDVRRFLTGQLVAAHRYTRRQRLARFAKRHRAALLVAALAATAVAVLSWFSVHRILEERDAATAARSEAEQQRRVADTQAAAARQRADQLLLAHARGLLDTSPTEAIAALKHLESTSQPTLDTAAAIAKAAVARGVAWGVRSLPGATASLELTRDGKRLLQVNRTGQLQIVDLELRKQIATFDIGRGSGATWVDADRKILVDRDRQPPALLDPATGALDPIGTVELKEYDKTPGGELVGFIDANYHAGIIDIAAKKANVIWAKSAERAVAIAPDGKWLAFGDRVEPKRSRLVVVDRSGAMLFERPGSATLMAVSPAGKLAVSLFEELIEVRPGEPPVKVAIDSNEGKLVHQLAYRGEVLNLVGARSLITWTNNRLGRTEVTSDTAYLAQPAAGNVMVVGASDRQIHLVRYGVQLALALTDAPEGMYRVTAATGSSRVVATAKDTLLVWETAALFPTLVDGAPGMFLAPRRALVPDMMGPWYVWDVDTNARTPIKLPIEGIPVDYMSLPDENRLIAIVQTPRGNVVIGVHADGKAELLVEDLGKGRVNIVPGNAIVYSLGKGRIFGKVGTEPSRELVTLDGELQSIAANGTLGYAAVSSTGELVKGTFGGANFVRTRVADLDKGAFVVADAAAIYIGSGNRLLRWRTDVQEVARFAVPIDFLAPSELGLYVTLSNRDVFFVPATGNQTPQRVPISSLASMSRDGKVLVGVSASQQVELVDMPALAPWTLPKLLAALPGVHVSPDGQRIVQNLGAQVGIWKIAQPGSDFGAWLAELTNATEDEGHVRWPWQP
jgi:serine/threonine protein kinase